MSSQTEAEGVIPAMSSKKVSLSSVRGDRGSVARVQREMVVRELVVGASA
jgi:hypothetical protein